MTAVCRFLAVMACCSLAGAAGLNFSIDSIEGDALAAGIMKTVTKADSLNKAGLDALDKKQFAKAMDRFDEALRVLPDFSDAQNNRGVVKFRKGDIGGAQEIWERLAVKDPGYAIVSYNLALVQLHGKQYDAAIRLLERALKADKKFVEAQVRLGVIRLERGEKTKALDLLRKAYGIAPSHPDAWSFYSYALVESGDTSGAIAVLEKKRDKPEALKLLGRIESARKNYTAASDFLSRAISMGADPSALLELAGAQMDAKDCKGAQLTLRNYFERTTAPAADAFLLAGIAAKECGDINASQGWFEKGISNFPGDGILRYNLGQVYFYQKEYDRAEGVWAGLADTLQDPSLLYMRAMNAKRAGNLSSAEALIRRVLDIDEQAEYHDFLGVILCRRGNKRAAEEEFRKALKLNPHLRSAQVNLALSAKSAAELAAAARSLEQKLSACAEDSCAEIALELSVIYYCQKMTDKAAAVLASVRESERDERIYRTLALFYRELNEWSRAITALETAVAKYVTEPQTDYELAEAYLTAGFYPKAIERLTLLLDRWQKNPWRIYYQLGYAYLEQNDLAKAKACFKKSLNSRKDNSASRGMLAFIHYREGNIAQARELWKKNLDEDPSNPVLWVNMGLSCERDGKYDEALRYYKKAADLKGGDPQIQVAIGNVYAAAGQFTDALAAYKRAIESPKREVAVYNIFLVYAKKKERDQAEKYLRILEKEFASSVSAKRAQAEVALWKGDTARGVTLLSGMPEKETGDWMRLSQIYAAQGRQDKAREFLEKVPDEAPWESERSGVLTQLAFLAGDYAGVVRRMRQSRDTGFTSQYNLALAHYQLKQYEDALVTAERAVKNAAGNDRADLCRLAGNAAFGLKRWDRAKQWYLQLSNIEAGSAVVQYNLAVASYNLGDVEDAWRYYGRARELDPKIHNADIEKRYAAAHASPGKDRISISPTDSLYNAAVDLQNTGNDSAAEKLYREIVLSDSLYNLAWNNLGAIYGKWGEIEKAEHSYRKAVEKKHDIPETYANLVNLYIELEEFSKARQWLIKGEGHNPESDLLKELRKKIIAAEKKNRQK
ncbi:MAG: tetratricopeptide repeat protein [Chitinispirillaceae bacterium]|nr:tetratricopeptide repeat protein [Chitinispirillaceae bacterium]